LEYISLAKIGTSPNLLVQNFISIGQPSRMPWAWICSYSLHNKVNI